MDFNHNNNQYGGNYYGFNQPQNNQGYNPEYNAGQYGPNPYYNPMPNGFYNNSYDYQPQPMYNYGYQNNQARIINQQKIAKLLEQKTELRKFSTIFALAMLGYLVVSVVFVVLVEILGLSDLFFANGTFSLGMGILISVFSIGIPFFIAEKVTRKKEGLHEISYATPRINLKTLCIILFSVFGCLLSMNITGYFQSFFEMFGFVFSSGEEPNITGIADIIGLFVGIAVVPPLIEEFAIRNVVMQPLRKYGNAFAIVASAIFFGILHGTPTQIPFAILSGLFLGYAAIATDSIWTSIIIHAIVNGLSCCYSTVCYYTDEETALSVHGIICLVFMATGIASLIIYMVKYKNEFKRVISDKGLQDYSFSQKLVKFIFSPVMIIALIVFLLQAASLISFEPGANV